ncbi:protein-L-isoaspartate(D-aspartate) O-methyltransferase [Candidatus Woesearchaeota archaeon]|nr:protein-L-isoaspartate(D-aspartate) O-methyltransferase [Candidatus Woesearchaeota archaeon]
MVQKEHLISFWRERRLDERLIDAFLHVPREFFVSPDLLDQAYHDHPLPTLRGQSLSQPSTVMFMTQALDIREGHTVLEIGSGVGFQACLLGYLTGSTGKVITTEIIPELVHVARRNVEGLKCSHVQVLERDGSQGVPEEAPFDRVMITAACPQIPQPIIEQTKEGGIIVAPIGDLKEQTMVKATKVGKRLEFEFLGNFVFVPMQGKYGFKTEINVNV